MKHTLISTLIVLALGSAGTVMAQAASSAAAAQASAATSQDKSQDSSPPSPKQLKAVVVTGSRIPRAEVEGPSPVIVISAKDIDAHGFRNAFDALSALSQNTGMVTGTDFGSTFTPVGNFLNLRNLGPNHTLVLVNGHRMAEYPVAYNGSVNAVNLANIPSQSIERIEILDAGASAIYGSDAIAGVVNIILKQHYAGTDLNLRTGGTQGGGGSNQRLQLTHGFEQGKFNGVVGLELNRQQPIHFGDRHLSSSFTRGASDPTTSIPGVAYVRDPVSNNYYAPPAGACDALAGYLGGSINLVSSNRYDGSYCGSDRYYDNGTIQPGKRQASGFASLHYDLNDHVELYGDFLADDSKLSSTLIGPPSWATSSGPVGPFWNSVTQRLENWSRTLTPEEAGGLDNFQRTYLERSWSASMGARGQFGDSDWHYDANYSISEYFNNQSRLRFLSGLDAYFLGPQTGTQDYLGETFPVYAADPSKLYTPLTPAQYASLTARSTERDRSWVQGFNFSVNGTLADLPGGELGVAAVAEVGSQAYHDNPDARIDQGYYWNTSQDDPAGGRRDNYALGVELSAPVLTSLTATAAARYDHFRAAGNDLGKATYNVGLEYRPIKSLLLRGSYATSFRAPDMNYTFASSIRGYFPSQTDYYQCRLDGQEYSSCSDYYNMNYLQTGNAKLKPETAKSYTYGLVWSPGALFDLSMDYYHIVISNEVTDLDVDQLLRTEADCREGQNTSGSPVDPSSALCVDYLSRVTRNAGTAPVAPNQVQLIRINPINAASEHTSGIDTTANLKWDDAAWGKFGLNLDYTLVLSHKYQQFPGDPQLDYRNDISYQTEWRSRINASLNWSRDAWSASLYGARFGEFPKEDYSGRLAPYVLFNGSVGYQFNDRTKLSVIVNNLANRMPVDRSGGWPNYPSSVYDIYGRQWWLELNYHFGRT